MRETENPYQAPIQNCRWGQVSRYPTTSRFKFFYVGALIICLSLVVTFILAPKYEWSFLIGMQFFGVTAAGPFITLSPLIWGMRPLSVPIMALGILIFLTTVCYLIKPNNVSLVISLLSTVAWVSVAPILVMLLPELGIAA